MSKGQKPRTPRYFPRMKVRGARRKRMRTMYVFQRIGDAGRVSATAFNAFATGMINAQISINRMLARQRLADEGYYGSVTLALLDMLGESIREEQRGTS